MICGRSMGRKNKQKKFDKTKAIKRLYRYTFMDINMVKRIITIEIGSWF